MTAVNAAIQGLRVTPAANSTAAVTLTVSSTDGVAERQRHGGHHGQRGQRRAGQHGAPRRRSSPRTGRSCSGLSNANRITVDDVDAASDDVAVTLTATDATFSLGSTTGVVVTVRRTRSTRRR